ncbi:hypothetical protein GRF59_07085 [Paenibacillus sp. HJL G12]|uniref:Uncharacterized protein n=1 Tax=Paenibacillus dendrobii TaxID=2691084 RepID=A0A7X3IGA1_9BACL|nr:hypothetical protein [Paenibacillus dendrobii]MWV43394.1 hypothetical protein [Paenibacillus dendrobii]
MSKYAQAAIEAVELVYQGVTDSPVKAWDMATSKLFGKGSWGQKKGCPKNAFLGLCEDGFIEGIPKGIYNTRENSINKNYAIRAIELITEQPKLLEDIKELWNRASNGNGISHNHQMHIVKALYNKNYIKG